MIIYEENLTDSMKEPLELVSESSKTVRSKWIFTNQLDFYTLEMNK